MEDTHGASNDNGDIQTIDSLNPYYNGRYSWSCFVNPTFVY